MFERADKTMKLFFVASLFLLIPAIILILVEDSSFNQAFYQFSITNIIIALIFLILLIIRVKFFLYEPDIEGNEEINTLLNRPDLVHFFKRQFKQNVLEGKSNLTVLSLMQKWDVIDDKIKKYKRNMRKSGVKYKVVEGDIWDPGSGLTITSEIKTPKQKNYYDFIMLCKATVIKLRYCKDIAVVALYMLIMPIAIAIFFSQIEVFANYAFIPIILGFVLFFVFLFIAGFNGDALVAARTILGVATVRAGL